jgi:SAM-dependent MidA family methyltransferase
MPKTQPLVESIQREIRAEGPISFARFMDRALYDPEHGYYSRGPVGLGTGGDFVTASDVGTLFGNCIATQISEIDERVGPFDPFHVVEHGCGRGLLARDVLDGLADGSGDLVSRLRYVMVDRSPAMRAAAAVAAPEAIPLAPHRVGPRLEGCVLAVELFDALPVHRVRRVRGRLCELRVDCKSQGEWIEREVEAPEALQAYAERYGVAVEEGHEAEIGLEVPTVLEAIAAGLERGILLIIDYGHPADLLYDADRPKGTLLAYHRNTTNRQFFDRVGEQDLTAHVNFSALEDRALDLGLAVLGRTTQDRFLIGNGLLEAFETDDSTGWREPRSVKRRMQAMQLIHPEGMGRAFRVLALAKGCRSVPQLRGLIDPFAREEP